MFGNSLVQNGIISRIDTMDEEHTNSYTIADVEKYELWSKSKFYTAIEKNIIPVLSSMIEVATFVMTQT